jgi:hypothetical protein
LIRFAVGVHIVKKPEITAAVRTRNNYGGTCFELMEFGEYTGMIPALVMAG